MQSKLSNTLKKSCTIFKLVSRDARMLQQPGASGLMPVILATQEADMGGSWFEISQGK
jgi:hypothetical protein